MATYWITFRIGDDAGYSDRYDALHNAIDKASAGWWIEPTSFYMIDSALSIDALASRLKEAIEPRSDMFLIGRPEFKSARVCGVLDYLDSLRGLVPFVKVV